MKYQFKKAPTRDEIIEEFGLHPDRVHRIETFIHHAAVGTDQMNWQKDRFTMGETARMLVDSNLAEAFALLCAAHGWVGFVFFLAGDPRLGALVFRASFDRSGALREWRDAVVENIPCKSVSRTFRRCCWPEQSPREMVESGWVDEARQAAFRAAEFGCYLRDSDCVFAVSPCRLSAVQWRRKFVSERWWRPDLKPVERLVDSEDLVVLESFLASNDEWLARLDKFEEWAADRDSWDGEPEF